MFRKLLWGLVTLGLLAGLAHAANVNQVQRDDGRTLWIDSDGNTTPVGDSGLTVQFENVSTSATQFVVSHKAGRITKVYSVLYGAIGSADAVFKFTIIGSATQTVGATVTTLTIQADGSAAGDQDSVAPDTGAHLGTGVNITNAVAAGDVIAIFSNGESTTDADAVFTFVIE